MKKLFLQSVRTLIILVTYLLFFNSCNRQDTDGHTDNIKNDNKGMITKTGSTILNKSSFMLKLNLEPDNKCYGGSTYINVDPLQPFYDDFNIYCYDGYTGACSAIGNGKPCIDLSHFLGRKGAYIGSNGTSIGKGSTFYGDGQQIAFLNYYPTGYGTLYTKSFSIGAESNSYFWTGGIYGTMPNEAANTVLQFFKSQIDTLPVTYSGTTQIHPKIAAVHFIVTAYLCDPPYREVQMTVKYYY